MCISYMCMRCPLGTTRSDWPRIIYMIFLQQTQNIYRTVNGCSKAWNTYNWLQCSDEHRSREHVSTIQIYIYKYITICSRHQLYYIYHWMSTRISSRHTSCVYVCVSKRRIYGQGASFVAAYSDGRDLHIHRMRTLEPRNSWCVCCDSSVVHNRMVGLAL